MLFLLLLLQQNYQLVLLSSIYTKFANLFVQKLESGQIRFYEFILFVLLFRLKRFYLLLNTLIDLLVFNLSLFMLLEFLLPLLKLGSQVEL
jgi:hypothetical protein